MQYPSQHWPQNAAPPGSGAGGQPNSGGGGGGPQHPNYVHHGHAGGPPPQHHSQGGWGHHPQQQAPLPPSHHSSHRGTSHQLPPAPTPTIVPMQPSPPGGIFRERNNGSGGKLPTEMTNGYPPQPPHPPHMYDGNPPPPHGYSHGPGYGYSPHSAQGGQQPPPPGYYSSQQPPGYYSSQHQHPHHGHSGPPPPPPEHSQWGHHPSHGPVPPPGPGPPPPPPNSSSQWEQHQHSNQSRRSENPHSSEAYYSTHPSSSYSRHGPPPPVEVGPPTPESNGARAPYIPGRSGEAQPPSSQQSHGKSSNSHHGSQHSQSLESSSKRKASPPQSSLSSADSAVPLPRQDASMPPLHHPHAPPPPSMTLQQQPPTAPHGYPSSHHQPPPQQQQQQHHGVEPPAPRHPNPPSIHSTTSTYSTPSTTARTPNAAMMGVTSSQSLVPPHHYHTSSSSLPPSSSSHLSTPGALSTSTTSYTDDEKGRGSYKCGRCGVPKKGHVCPYQPKVKRRPEDAMPEMKCVSTQVEMDEFMTLRRLNIEIQGYPESYAAEPMDMVGAEVGHHPPPYRPPLPLGGGMRSVHSGQPIVGSEPSVGMAPRYPEQLSGPPPHHHLHAGPPPPSSFGGPFSTNSSSHLSGPPSTLPSLSSMPSQPPGPSYPPYPQHDPYTYSSAYHAAPIEEGNLPPHNADSADTIKPDTTTLSQPTSDVSVEPAVSSVEVCNAETHSIKEEDSTNVATSHADEETPIPKSDESSHANNDGDVRDAVAPPDDSSPLIGPEIKTKGSLEAETVTSPMNRDEDDIGRTTDGTVVCESNLSKEEKLSNAKSEIATTDNSTASKPIESPPDNSDGNCEEVVTPISSDDTLKQGDLSADVVTKNTEDETLPSTSESVPVARPEDCGADSEQLFDNNKKRNAEDLILDTETLPIEESSTKRRCVQSSGNDSLD